MASQKIVVLISGSGTNLQAIVDKLHKQPLNNTQTEVVAVISNKADAYGLQRAQDAGIDAIVVASKGIASREEYDAKLSEALDKLQPDLIILAGFMRILTSEFVNKYLGKMVNIHPSLLPKYTGINTHQRAIDAGDEEHGASVHFVTPELDSGPIVLQAKVPVFSDDTAEDLSERVLTQEHQIYPLVAQWFLSGRLSMQDNKAILDGKTLPENGYAAD
jgi:phosphoribosylglycinamide formyltransferase-1